MLSRTSSCTWGLVAVLAAPAACAPKDHGDGGDSAGSGSSTGQGGSSTGQESTADTGQTSLGSSEGDSGGTVASTTIATLEPDGTLVVTIANHDAATCDDPTAVPDLDYEDCELDIILRRLTVSLHAPFDVPGEFDTEELEPYLAVTSSERTPNDSGPCGTGSSFALGGLLTLTSLGADGVVGEFVLVDSGEEFTIDTALCP